MKAYRESYQPQPQARVLEKKRVFQSLLLGLLSTFYLFSTLSCQFKDKFGNSQKITLEGYDLISGYYTTQFKSLQMSASFQGFPSATTTLPESWLKPNWAMILGNPTLLYFDEPTKNIGTLRSSIDTTFGFELSIDPNAKKFSLNGVQEFYSGNCTWTYQLTGSGSFRDISSSPKMGDLQTRGSLNIVLKETHDWVGDAADCEAWLSNYKACFFGTNPGCTQDDQDFARSLFGTAFDAAILQETNFEKLTHLETLATF